MNAMPNGFSCLSPKNGLKRHAWFSQERTKYLSNRILDAFRVRNQFVAYVCSRCKYATVFAFTKGPKR